MEPLEVVFHLRTPVALGFPWISFDALLAHIRLKEELGERYYSLPTKVPAGGAPDVPIKRWRDVPVASVSIFEPEPQLQLFQYFKRGDLPFPKGRVSRASGFFKDFYLRAAYAPVQRVRFYCTGEKEEVERLCRKVPALGKERNIGFGFVKGVEVREVVEEWGLVRGGLAMRPIPVRYLKRWEDAAYLAYKPPYWSKKSVDLCCVPFTGVELA
jgi:hypothetical protein